MEVFATLFLIAVIIYLLNKYYLSYWTRHGFSQLPSHFLFGNLWDLVSLKKCIGAYFGDIYKATKENPITGIYFFYRPALVINDIQLALNIVTKDFQYFHDRGLHVNEVDDPLSGHLFSLSGDRWKALRQKIAPTFTSGRLKEMFPIILENAKELQEFVTEAICNESKTIDVSDILARSTISMVSSIGFGVENDSLRNPDNIFRQMALKVLAPDVMSNIRISSSLLVPTLSEFLKIKFVSNDVEHFFISLVEQTIEYREANNFKRNDFMQLLLQLKNEGFAKVIDASQHYEGCDEHSRTLALNEIAAQVFVFFLAGYETTSSTMSFCLFELAKNQNNQRRARDEINEITKGDFTYDNINCLKFLDCCIDETLRKYPVVPMLNRICTKDYKIPDTKLIIPEGTPVIIPLFGMHRDPQFYPNPMEFRPERFLEFSGNKSQRLYIPFGDGPRICIGLRMGRMVTKLYISMLLSRFKFELVDRAMTEIEFSTKVVFLTPLHGVHLKVSLCD